MSKFIKLSAGFMAAAMFVSCSNDVLTEEGVNTDGNKPVGDVAYMAVKISNVNDRHNAKSRTTDDDFAIGEESEHKVNHAQFFFFDKDGVTVLRAGYIYDPDSDFTDHTSGNVESVTGKNVVVLENMTGNNYPEYMMTVLNAPDFTAEATLAETAEKLVDWQGRWNEEGRFVMCTSSYFGDGANHDNINYYVTKITPNDFKNSFEEARNATDPLEVYVERLAAKVAVKVSSEIEDVVTLADGTVLYKLAQSVAGEDNDDNNPSGSASTELYVEVTGWGLNATADQSHMAKILDLNWKDNGVWAAWNEANKFRSYWGKSTAYGKSDFDGVLTYRQYKDLTKAVGQYEYCNENTNTPENITTKKDDGTVLVNNAAVTHVVLKARVCDKQGNGLDLISHRGVLFLSKDYKAYILNRVKTLYGLNCYYYVNSTTDGNVETKHYAQVGVDDLKFIKDGEALGKVQMVLADESKQMYAKKDDGIFEEISSETLVANLKAVQGETPLVNYNGGASVYYIPVQHLVAHEVENAAKNDEGYYGVVRNHWYNISINSFSKVGHGVFDPENGNEIIVPDEPEDPYYYLGARINILSWRLVDQNVDL